MSYHSVGAAPGPKQLSPAEILKAVNGVGAQALSPLAPIIKALPGVPVSIKNKIVSRPIDALIDILDPIEAALIRVTKRINKSTGKMTRKVFFSEVDMRQVDDWAPSVRSKLDGSLKNLLRRLLSLNHFIALFWDEPLLLAAEMYAEGYDIADGMTKSLAKKFGLSEQQAKGVVALMHSAVPIKSTHVLQMAKAGTAAWGAAERAAKDAQKTAQGAASAVANFFGLGDGGVVSVPAAVSATAVTEVAAAGGVSIPPGVASTIAWVLTAALGLVVTGAKIAMDTASDNSKTMTQAEADVMRLQAQGQADALRLQASGQAEGLRLQSQAGGKPPTRKAAINGGEPEGNKSMLVVLGVGAVVAAIVLLKK